MSDVSVRFPEGGEVTIEGLDGKSYSHVTIEKDWTTFQIKAMEFRVGFGKAELRVDGELKYEESWPHGRLFVPDGFAETVDNPQGLIDADLHREPYE